MPAVLLIVTILFGLGGAGAALAAGWTWYGALGAYLLAGIGAALLTIAGVILCRGRDSRDTHDDRPAYDDRSR